MADAQLKAIITAEDRASKVLKNVGSSLNTVNSKLKELQPTFQKMAIAGTAGFTALSAGIAKTVKDASQFKSLEVSFERLANQANVNTQDLLSSLRNASAGTVSQTNLMLSSNRAFALGVGQDLEGITTLMEIARLKGRAMGLDTTQAFNDIVTGIGRGSPLILDNLGITIKLGEAQQLYAQKLGKTTAQLSDAEKKQAILNAVLESGSAELAQAGEVALTTDERMQQLKTKIANLSVTIGENFIPVLEKILITVTPVIEKVSTWIQENPKLATTILVVVTAVFGIIAVLGTLGLVLPVIIGGISALGVAIAFVAANPIVLLIAALVLMITKVKLAMDEVGGAREFFRQTWDGIKIIFSDAINSIIGFFEPLINKINKVKSAVSSLKSSLSTVGSSIGGVVSGGIGSLFGRATHGAVNPNTPVMVGERGAEVFVPNTYGHIRPASAGGGINITITGNSFMGREGVAEQIGNDIMRSLKRNTKI